MYSNILVPLDGSSDAEKAILHAREQARRSGGTVHLLHVINQIRTGVRAAGEVRYPTRTNLEVERLYEEGQIEAEQQYLERLAAELQSDGINVVTDVEVSTPHDYIVDYSRRNGVDLIVMTKHGHGGFRQFLIGGTTDRVLRSSDVPVLVVHVS